MSDGEFLSANAAADALAAGDLTSEELVDALLARIERLEPRLGAFVALYADEARAAARAADLARRAGQALGRFHGVPIALKDIIDLEGRITTGGSKVWEERVSGTTATLARRLVAAGVIVLGKTRTVEFAMGAWGTNRHMGTPWNPWDFGTHRAPGGSSSGSGVAVAARLAPWAIGSDTGGSVRIPSAWNGLTGLKVTFGRVSCHGVLPLAHTLDTPGPMCRTVEDAADLYRLVRGPDPLDPATLNVPDGEPGTGIDRGIDRGIAGMRLARMPAHERDGVDADVLAAYDESLTVLSELGANVVDVELPRRFVPMGDLVGRIIAAEGYSWVGEYIDDDTLPVDDDVRPRIRPGGSMSAGEYIRVQRERAVAKREFDEALAGVDALLTPAVRTAAPAVADIDQSTTAAIFTRPFNLIDYCALVVPNGLTEGGLPLSLQIACRGFEEGTALRIGLACQRATDWHTRVPPGLDDRASGRTVGRPPAPAPAKPRNPVRSGRPS